MRKDKQLRQGLTREQWSKLANFAQADGITLSEAAETLLSEGIDKFEKQKREYPTYRCLNVSKETYAKINSLSKKLKVKKSEIIRAILTKL